jgi:hypothetical protein
MKTLKNLAISSIMILSLSSFGLLNNADLLFTKSGIIAQDSTQHLRSEKKLASNISLKEVQEKDINKQEQQEDKNEVSIASQIGYLVLIGIKSVLTFVLKLFTL